jgi:Doubled CXXCH motif (Paired_CXXCH_1)
MSAISVMKVFIIGFGGIVFSMVVSPRLHSQILNQKCLICHGKRDFSVKKEDGSIKSLFVNDSLLKESPHNNIACYDCHNDIVEITALGHKKDVKQVQCTHCHFENNPVGAPETEKYREFQESVHQQERLKGNTNTPICQTCHGTHDIVKRKSLSTLELKKKITKTCGKCHLDIYTAYSTSIHGQALFEKGSADVPACTDCHGEHTIKKADDPLSSVYKTKIYNTCGNCHASEKIVEKYGINADRFKTYETSYHGIAGQFGEKTVANCASCHGVHDIKQQNDPSSSINPNNIVKTCGKCHPDANVNYAKGRIHINPHSEESGSIFYISSIFKWLTLITITLLAIHVMLDLFRKIRHKTR